MLSTIDIVQISIFLINKLNKLSFTYFNCLVDMSNILLKLKNESKFIAIKILGNKLVRI